MKVRFGKEEHKAFYVSEVPAIRAIQSDCKEVDIVSMAKSAMNVICPRESFKIFEPTATIAKNQRVSSNYFTNYSGKIDVWVEFVAFSSYAGCYECGVYLSDIYNIWEGTDKSEFAKNMYIRHYKYNENFSVSADDKGE